MSEYDNTHITAKHPNLTNAGKGRPKGALNRVKAQVRDAIQMALEDGEGATQFFVDLKNSDPKTFATVATKLIPIQVQADIESKVDNNITVRVVTEATETSE